MYDRERTRSTPTDVRFYDFEREAYVIYNTGQIRRCLGTMVNTVGSQRILSAITAAAIRDGFIKPTRQL